MKDDPLGKDYRGTINVGKRGAKCLSWSALDGKFLKKFVLR